MTRWSHDEVREIFARAEEAEGAFMELAETFFDKAGYPSYAAVHQLEPLRTGLMAIRKNGTKYVSARAALLLEKM